MTTAHSQNEQAGTFTPGGIAVVSSITESGGVRVEAKAMDVLVALAVASPSVTSVRGLLDAGWPSEVVRRHRHALPAVLASFANLWRALRLGL